MMIRSKLKMPFRGLTLTAIIASYDQNKKRVPTVRRYPEEVKRFTLTPRFYA